MLEAILLGALVLCDAVFAGFRAAAGRDPRLYKVDYYLRSVWVGAIAGVTVIALLSALIGATLALSSDPAGQFQAYLASARDLLWVYGSYATIVLLAMGMWTYPAPDMRTLASVLVLGPFTLLRPYVVLGGGVVAMAYAADWQIRAVCFVAVSAQLAVEPVLDAMQAKAQKARIAAL